METLFFLVMRASNFQTVLDNADEFGYDVAENYKVEGALNLDTGNFVCTKNGFIPQELRTEAGLNKALGRVHTQYNGEYDIRQYEASPMSAEDMSVTILNQADKKGDTYVAFISAYIED